MDVEIGNGRYRLIRRLGEGGTGCVYQAADLLLGRTVAIKALHDRQSTQLLREEARSLAGLNHPNVVGLYDLLESEGRACLVMEYVNGCSLDRWLVERGPLGLGAALEVFRQVAEAVMQAHRQRMLHCDLKPANVLVSTSGQVKLTDFTLARRLREGRFDGPTGGSARYAAPEQLSGAAVSPRTDVYGPGA
jgi:serine/threonine-protein kinase